MHNRKLSILCLVVFCCISVLGVAQPPGGGPPGGGGNPGSNAPISGIEIFLALGALLGIKKVLTINKKDIRN